MGKALIIKGANFKANAVDKIEPITASYILVNGISLFGAATPLSIQNLPSRANAFALRDSVTNPCAWASSVPSDFAQQYSAIPIPTGATKVTIQCSNSSYYFGLALWPISGSRVYDSGWTQGGGKIEVLLQNYQTAVYVTSSIKIGSAGTESFTNETLQSLGWKITFV